jgi:hypothetical protein
MLHEETMAIQEAAILLQNEGRLLIVCSPGGFEHYFEEMIEAIGKAGGIPDKKTMTALFKKYDVQGPAELE